MATVFDKSASKAKRPLVDIQNQHDDRNIPIDRVGVRNVKYPITVKSRDGEPQRTVGTFTLTVDLPREFKGTHMSRFMEVLSGHSHDISGDSIPDILTELRERLSADTSHIEVKFVLFMEKSAPVTGKKGMMGYECGFIATGGHEAAFQLYLNVPVTTLCPCSKEISDFGAHNQRGYVSLKIASEGLLWLEDVIELVEQSASAPLYPVLKRPDEKFVTELAYLNPRFVEDIVREVSLRLDQHPNVIAYEVEVENHESIHDHNAYAYIARHK